MIKLFQPPNKKLEHGLASINSARKELESVEFGLDAAKKQIKEQEKELVAKIEEIARYEKKMDEVKQQYEAMVEKMEAARADKSSIEKEKESATVARNNALTALAKVRHEHRAAVDELSEQFGSEHERLQEAIRTSKDILSAVEEDIETSTQIVKKNDARSNQLLFGIEEKKAALRAVESELTKCSESLKARSLELHMEEEKVDLMKDEYKKQRTILKEVEQALSAKMDELVKVNNELSASREKILSNIQREKRVEELAEKIREICEKANIPFTL